MAVYDHDDDQISMAGGDDWYFDEFGEYRNSNADQLENEDLADIDKPTQEFGETATTGAGVGGDILADDEFNETLRSEYIDDQIGDPNLQKEAESDYTEDQNKGIGEKIKDKFDDLTS